MTREEALKILENNKLIQQQEYYGEMLYRQIGEYIGESDDTFSWAVHPYS
jgi:hypothetical protein